MASAISLICAHEIAEEVGTELWRAYPDAEVIIHEDPEGALEERLNLEG